MKISHQLLKQAFKSKLLWAGFAWLVLFPIVYNSMPVRIDMTMDKSLPYTVWITEKPFIKSKHNYAMFAPTVHNRYTKKVGYFFKEISCREGQELNTSLSGAYTCDGKFIGQAQYSDQNGFPVEHFVFNGKIPPHNFFMTGTHKRSYDSKYYGFIREEQIERGVIPIW